MPDGVETDKIEASFNNGVLAITLPKTDQAIEREVLINPGSDEKAMIIDFVKAGRQRWFFEDR